MPAKKRAGPGQYTVLRDFAEFMAGDIIELSPDDAALMVRDGMIAAGAPAEEEGT